MDAGKIKLLVIEDDPDYLELLQRTLAEAALGGGASPAFEVFTAGNLGDGISLLARNNTDAVLLDLFLPDSRGQDTFRQLYAQAPTVPIIVMSSLDDEATAIESVKAGAQDYLVKGRVAGDLLVRAIRYAIQRKQSERALQAAHDDLEQRIQERTAELAQVNTRLKKDIAERKKVEQALRDSEVKYRTLIQSGKDAIVSADATGQLVSWNQAATDMFGYSEGEILGQPIASLMPDRYKKLHWDRVFEQLQSSVLHTGQQTIEGFGLRQDGVEFPVELSLSNWTVGEGYFVSAIIRDVTDRRRIEQEVLQISEREQRRISQNLHDDLGQKLTGIAFLGQALAHRLEGTSEELSDDAARIAQQANEAINSARRLARELYPVNLEQNDLESALAELVAGVESYSGISCEMSCDITVTLKDHQVVTHLYRIAQEALSNAVRHSRAQAIQVKLTIRPELTQLEVRDDGEGLPGDLASVMGMGLHNMQYRANAIGGSLEIESLTAGGTEIVCSIKSN